MDLGDPCPLRRFAVQRLGPESERLLNEESAYAEARRRVQEGAQVADAVLAVVHDRARTDRAVANEFLAYFLTDLMQVGSLALGRELRRFLDTGDLVQSVLGDFWPKLAAVRFETRAQFVVLLKKRVDWRAAEKARQLRRRKSREDLRIDVPLDDVQTQRTSELSPVVGLLQAEDCERLLLLLLKLPRADRELLMAHMRGEPRSEIAERLGLTPGALAKKIERARRKLRELGGA